MLVALRWAGARWGPRRVALVAAAALVAWLAFALLAPEHASADFDIWDPRTYFEGLRDFGRALADIPGAFAKVILIWLLDIPEIGESGSKLKEAQNGVTMIALALSTLVLTASVLRGWLAGVSELGGPASAFQGVTRLVGAVALMAAWPWVFQSYLLLIDVITAAMLSLDVAKDGATALMATIAALVFGQWIAGDLLPGTDLLPKFLRTGALTLLLGLLAMKIFMVCVLGVGFVIMPLLFMLSPFPELRRMSSLGVGAVGFVGFWPVLWAACFLTFGALEQDFFLFNVGDSRYDAAGGVLARLLDNLIVQPLVAITMLYVLIYLPAKLTLLMAARTGAGRGPAHWLGGGWQDGRLGHWAGVQTERTHTASRRAGVDRSRGRFDERTREVRDVTRQDAGSPAGPSPTRRRRRSGEGAPGSAGIPTRASVPSGPPGRAPMTHGQRVGHARDWINQANPSPDRVAMEYGRLSPREQADVKAAMGRSQGSRVNLAANRAATAAARGDHTAEVAWVNMGGASRRSLERGIAQYEAGTGGGTAPRPSRTSTVVGTATRAANTASTVVSTVNGARSGSSTPPARTPPASPTPRPSTPSPQPRTPPARPQPRTPPSRPSGGST